MKIFWGSEALGAGPHGLEPWGDGTDVRSFVRLLVRLLARIDGRTDERKFSPVFYRTSSPSGLLPKRKQKVVPEELRNN